jgi:Zn-dependent protease with chaperone function
MPISGPGVFFDGETSARRIVTVELDPSALVIRSTDGEELARWPYDELEEVASRDGVLRLARVRNPVLARLEVQDPALAAAIDELSHPVDRTGTISRRNRRRVVLWSTIAVVSLLIVGIFGVPELAGRLTPLVPYAVERKMGEAVDKQVRAMFAPAKAGEPLECGEADAEKAGKAAFDSLVGRLEAAADLPMPIKAAVVRRGEANAFALPGGHIYVFDGLIEKSESPDELAGVIGHEMGHVAHRDGTRSILQGAGLSFVFGMVLGDFVGGGAMVFAAKTILQLSYSRDVEIKADIYGLELLNKVGGDAHKLGGILDRIAGAIEPGVKILLDHPQTKERVALIDRLAASGPYVALLSPPEWGALKQICAKK